MNPKIAYIDESGNHDLDTSKQGVSSYFIVAGLIVDESKNDRFLIDAEAIRLRHFQTAEVKSSKIRANDDHKRRIKILNDILVLDFTFYALAVDKNEINKSSGYQYKKSFIKNLNGKLFGSLFQHYDRIKVIADEHGNNDFSSSLKAYVEKRYMQDLFRQSTFETMSSKGCVGIQIADFIAGTMAQIYEGKSNDLLKEKYIELVKNKSVGIDEWPIRLSPRLKSNEIRSEFDEQIFVYSLKKSVFFLESNSEKCDEETKMQVCILSFLLFHSQWSNLYDYVPTHVLTEHLNYSGYGNIEQPVLRSSIIAKLRDADVLIASSNKGYKIPTKFSDMRDYVEKVDSQIVPQLKRLHKARKSLLMATSNKLDIVDEDQFKSLYSIVENIDFT